MAKPKLALVPAAQGSKFYSVLPSSGVGDFNFTRSGSATRINSQGLIESVANGVSRLNYPMIDGVVKGCPHHILEPQRSNNFVQSNQFDTSWGIPSGITLTGNQLSPLSGGLDAWKLESDGSSGFLAINQSASITGTNTFSIYAKAGTNRYISLRGLSALDVRGQFDLIDGVVYGSSNDISTEIKHIKDGWYRCSVAFNASNNVFYIYPNIQGVATAGNIYIQYSQLEGGSFPTSIIPTTTSVVTRSAETANGSGDAATFNDSQGSLFLNINTSDTSAVPVISLSDGSFNNEIEFAYYGTNQWNVIMRVSGGTPNVVGTVNSSDFSKFSVSYTTNDFKVYLNGFLIGSNTLPSPLSGLNVLDFNLPNGLNNFYGNVKQIQYYDTALNSKDLEKLTSWVSFTDMAESQLYSVE